MTKVAIYCRVDHGTSEYGPVAIDCQRKQLERYAKLNGLSVAGYYADLGYTGCDMNRPALKNLIQDHNSGLFSTVLVVSIDRLFRSSFSDFPNWSFCIKEVNRETVKRECLSLGGSSCRTNRKQSI